MNAGKNTALRIVSATIIGLAMVVLPSTAAFAATTNNGGDCEFTAGTSGGQSGMTCAPTKTDCDNFCGSKLSGCSTTASCAGGATCQYAPNSCVVGQRTGGGTAPSAPAVRTLENPLSGVSSVQDLVGKAITIFTGISGSVALLMFVYGGVLLLTSGGAEDRVSKGKKAMVWATIGLVIIFMSYAILHLLFTAVGLSA